MLTAIAIVLYVIFGYCAGILAGIFGIGGGVITVPALLFVFHLLDFPKAIIVQTAVGTSLAAMVFNSFSAAWTQHKHHCVRWILIRTIIPGIILGSLLGAVVAHLLSGVILEIFFGIFLIILGVRFIRKMPKPKLAGASPKKLAWNAIGACIGFISNLLGIGGGALSVPVLTHYRYPTQTAAGTSSAMTLITTCIGAISYFLVGLEAMPYPGNLGYVNITAFFILGLVSFFAAPKGVQMGKKLSKDKFYRYFGWVLVIMGIFMIFI